MHTCKPPSIELDKWLTRYPSIKGRFGHLLLEQKNSISIDALRPYFASAHRDARDYFDRQTGIDLHPDADEVAPQAIYPGCLPSTARRGLFGEVLAGMITEHFQQKFVGSHVWSVPIFLFRHHADVEAYLFQLARDETRTRQVWGRFGSDFIGLSFNDKGEVIRFISGEAKWRKLLTQTVVDTLLLGKLVKKDGEKVRSGDGIWGQLNRDTHIPHGVRQLQRLLQERAPEEYAAAIVSLDRALLVRGGQHISRTNLVLIAGNAPDDHEAGVPFIDWSEPPPEYKAPHDLQVVELLIADGDQLIDGIYDTLWDGER